MREDWTLLSEEAEKGHRNSTSELIKLVPQVTCKRSIEFTQSSKPSERSEEGIGQQIGSRFEVDDTSLATYKNCGIPFL